MRFITFFVFYQWLNVLTYSGFENEDRISMLKQRTLKRVVKASGIGLHSGQKVMINFLPHVADGGIVFRRIDLNPPIDIPADAMLIKKHLCVQTWSVKKLRWARLSMSPVRLRAWGLIT